MECSNYELRRLMRERALKRAQVARYCGVGASTVDAWLAPSGASWYRCMKRRHYELLRFKVDDSVHAGRVR